MAFFNCHGRGQNPLALVIMGVSGCGKSTLAAALTADGSALLIEGDAHHPPSNIAKMTAGSPLDDADRWPWLYEIGRQMRNEVDHGRSAVAACSALKKAYRDRLRQAVGPSLAFVFLRVGERDLHRRMTSRNGHFMPPNLLASQLKTLEPPSDEPDAIDLDGRLPTEEQIYRLGPFIASQHATEMNDR